MLFMKTNGEIDWDSFTDAALEYISFLDFLDMTPIETVRQIEAGRRHDEKLRQEHPYKKDSGHYAHPPDMRRNIVSEWLVVKGRVTDMNQWAQTKYNIGGRTLRNYIKEVGKLET
jgi:hypothetical protein